MKALDALSVETLSTPPVLRRIESAAVRAALTPEAVGSRFGLELAPRRRGGYVSGRCPGCGPRRRAGAARRRGRAGVVIVNARAGWWHWRCCRCGLGGRDLIGLVAELAGLDRVSRYRAALKLAAEIAGVKNTTPPSRSVDEGASQPERSESRMHVRQREDDRGARP